MKSISSRIAIAAAVLAATGVVGANAADPQPQAADSTQAAHASQRDAAKHESKQFEFFENQLSLLSVPSYTPSEHPDAKPAPKSRHATPSVFDDPLNTASPG